MSTLTCFPTRLAAAVAIAAVLCGCAPPRSVYLGASDKNLYALQGSDGKLRWKQAVGGEIHTTPYHWAGNVIVAAADGVVYAFDTDSGKPLWHTALMAPQQVAELAPQSVLSTPVMPVNGVLYIGTGLGDVFEVGAASGVATLRAQLGVAGRQWLTASQSGAQVFATSVAGRAYAVDRVNGGIVWQQSVSIPSGPPAEAPNGGLAVPAQAGLVLLDTAHGGTPVTTYTAAGLVEGVAVDMTSGLTYIVSGSGAVQQLALQSGSAPGYNPVWSVQPVNARGYAPFYGGTAFPNTSMLVAYVNGAAVSVTPNSGGVNWNQQIDVDLAAAPTLAAIGPQDANVALMVSSAGHVFGVDPGNGSILWKQTSVVGGTVDASVAAP
jgi:outer membrane protein assembly factor BamB